MIKNLIAINSSKNTMNIINITWFSVEPNIFTVGLFDYVLLMIELLPCNII